MPKTGMIRKVDELGRIVLPIELRNTLDINTHDILQVKLVDEEIHLWKLQTQCAFCGGTESLRPFRTKQICPACLKELKILHEEDEY